MFYCKNCRGWCNQRFEYNKTSQQLFNHDTQAGNESLCLDIQRGDNILTQVWAKRQPGGAVAVFMVNSDNTTHRNISVPVQKAFGDVGDGVTSAKGATYRVRDVWQGADVGTIAGDAVLTARAVIPHGSRLLVLTPIR